MDSIYANAKKKIERAQEIDRKNKNVADLDSFMGGEYRRAQAALDEAHESIRAYLQKYSAVIDDDTIAALEGWHSRLPESVSQQ